MTDEKKKLATTQAPTELPAITSPGDIYFNLQLFEHIQRVATMFATSKMIPERYRNNVGDCTIALAMAHRLKADPIMVMQNTYVVHGSPGMEGKMVIALINQCGKFTQLLFREDKNADGDVVECTAYCCLRETGEEISSSITWDNVVAQGWDKDKGSMKSKWKTMRAQMFRYRAAAFLARTFCPEVLFGMQTVEELQDVIDITPDAGDKLNEMIVKNKTEPAPVNEDEDLSAPEKPVDIQENIELQDKEDLTEPESMDLDDHEKLISDDTAHPFNRTKWISCRAESSLEKMVQDHAESWETTTPETKNEFYDKWKRILKAGAVEAWPFESMTAPVQEDRQGTAAISAETYINTFKGCESVAKLEEFFKTNNTDILNHPEKDKIIAEYDRLMDANQEPQPLVTAQDFIRHIYHAEDTSALSMIGMRYSEVVDALPEKDGIWKRIDERMAELNTKNQ